MSELRSVIVVNDHAHINGGQAKVAIESAKGLAEQGLDVTFFAACGPVDDSLSAAGVRVVCLDQNDILSEPNRLRAGTRGLWNRPAASALRDLLRSFDPTHAIVHCHGFAKALSPAIGPVVTGGPLAHVYTMHEYFLACPNGGFYDYKSQAICHRRATGPSCLLTNCDARHHAHKVWRIVRQAVLWNLGNMPKGLRDVIFISRTQKRVIKQYLNPNTRLHHVPNPISLPQPERVRAESNKIFLFVGRLAPEKGGRLFADAARKTNIKAVFVGDGPERETIMQTNPAATITGWLGPAQVSAWIGKARCLVFPSLWYECQPLAPLEALARGVPVICGAWCAASEAILPGRTGELMDQPNVTALIRAIKTLQDDTVVRAQSQRAQMAELPTLESHTKQLMRVYSQSIYEQGHG